MSIKAIFPAGVTELTVHGLHQWDYGQKLEIQADDLPALIEVHFACAGMKDAVVRSCAVTSDGVAEAAVPDRCLEQTSPITAWIYLVDSASGTTVKTITLPIIARTQPQPSATVPEEVGDCYTEAVEEINKLLDDIDTLVESISDGDLPIENVAHADEATHAATAGTASLANYATSAGSAARAETADTAKKADTADSAAKATNDHLGRIIATTYQKVSDAPKMYHFYKDSAEWANPNTGFEIGKIERSLDDLVAVCLEIEMTRGYTHIYQANRAGAVNLVTEGDSHREKIDLVFVGGGFIYFSHLTEPDYHSNHGFAMMNMTLDRWLSDNTVFLAVNGERFALDTSTRDENGQPKLRLNGDFFGGSKLKCVTLLFV